MASVTGTAVARDVRRARSSFYVAMRLMPAERRAAMFAIYALARALDDIADGPGSPDEKRMALDAWRAELAAIYDGRPTTPIGKPLATAVARFRLPRIEFENLILGLETDIDGAMRAPTLSDLDLYCRRVATSIGLLALPVFGCDGPRERFFAERLGLAMQLTNILRDIEEDAARDRLYVPREFLRAAGVDTTDPSHALAHPGFPEAWRMLRDHTDAAFAQARTALAACPKPRRLWPALVMMGVYGRVLRAVGASGFLPGERVRIGVAAQLWVAVQVLVSARA